MTVSSHATTARPWQYARSAPRILSLYSLACLLALLPLVTSYASWMPCYIELDPDEIIMNYSILTVDQSPHTVQIEVTDEIESSNDSPEVWSTEYTFDPDKVTTLHARLRIPDDLMNYPEVQYVIETSPGAQFTRPQMCQGQRAHGRNFFEKVTLQIDGPSAPNEIALTAAWATGHSPVSLSLPIVLKSKASGDAAVTNDTIVQDESIDNEL
jgi:hypothetical protein